MNTFRSSLAALLVAGTAMSAAAQTQTVCFSGQIPLQPTNWSSSVSIPKFDPNLGTLQSISFQLTGNVQGTARAESLDAAPTIVNTSFSANITLTRPDNTPIVVTLPLANFSDSFTAFDNVLDFAGTSGTTHSGINVTDTQSQTSPPPASDLVLFTGPGNIVLPVTAQGSSLATGAGNLITQFTTDASADVQVCYTFLPNTPPSLNCPGTLAATAGVPFTFQVCASDVDPNDTVTITASNVPAGMTFNPALPASGNPICVTASWNPAQNQLGVFNVTFTATDTHQRTSTCTVTIVSAECHFLVSSGSGNAGATLFGHYYDTQLNGVRRFWPVTMDDIPSFSYSQLPAAMFVQVVMYNPTMFPANPEQYSHAMRVVKTGVDDVTTEYFGSQDGIGIRAQVYDFQGETRVRFPFTVFGM